MENNFPHILIYTLKPVYKGHSKIDNSKDLKDKW